ncbi:unnamed protein product [Nippostrongylus brasiliensis]|uniref:Ovule protein n=1 Tax=Nippostrongylus brasiliensis TaxID=27835 RepID=A0A0N4XPQ2_NIPBR|nr:unnamed protein product [Nippostrongylus brasiliensis]
MMMRKTMFRRKIDCRVWNEKSPSNNNELLKPLMRFVTARNRRSSEEVVKRSMLNVHY